MFFRKKDYMRMSAEEICSDYLNRINQKSSINMPSFLKKTLNIGKKYLRNTCIALAGIAIFSSCAGINKKYDNLILENNYSVKQDIKENIEEDRFEIGKFNFSFGAFEDTGLSRPEKSAKSSTLESSTLEIQTLDSRLTQEVRYTVQKGDFLSKIGKKFNVDYKKIASYNNIQNPNLISVGQELIIPFQYSKPEEKPKEKIDVKPQEKPKKKLEYTRQKDIGVDFIGREFIEGEFIGGEIFRTADSKSKVMTLEDSLKPVSEPYNHKNETEYIQRLSRVIEENPEYSYLNQFIREIAAGAYAESRFRDIEVNDKRENSTGYHQIPNYKDKNYDFHCKIFGSKYDPKDKDTSILVYLSLVEYYASWVQGVSTTWNPLTAEEKAKVRENMTEEHVRLAIIGHNLPAKLRPKSIERTKKGWDNPSMLGNKYTTGLTVSAKRYLDYVKKAGY